MVDLLRDGCPYRIIGVTISSGSKVVGSGKEMSVPKQELVGSLEVALSTRRLHCEPGLGLAKELEKELRSFGYEMTPTGRPRFEARTGHDDLVMAMSLAVWGGERGGTGTGAFMDFMRAQIAGREEVPA